ncbi:MAG TPA: hypothetical protein VN651_01545 [Gemmatimonadaceae bacterium]|nr:hypothetical protein [Gemmatimonadaceae bacterium]
MRAATLLVLGLFAASAAQAQVTPPAPASPLPPATKLEAFKPSAGSVLTIGYTELGHINGVAVDVREMRDVKGADARGVVVEVTESQYRSERSFVDADELPELIRGIDALLATTTNPTAFTQFEVRYTTHGDLQLTAFNKSRTGDIGFAVQAGRTLTAQDLSLSTKDIQQLRAMFVAAQTKLAALPK